MEISEWVKAARKHKGLTMEALGSAVGVTKGNVFHWEHGNHNPSFAQVLKIKAITGIESLPMGASDRPLEQYSHEAIQLAFYFDC